MVLGPQTAETAEQFGSGGGAVAKGVVVDVVPATVVPVVVVTGEA